MKKVKLISDYTPLDKPNVLSILQDDDGDFHLNLLKMNDTEREVRIATSGTRYSPSVRRALGELMKAIEEESL